jgi:hypothetical protein
VRRSLKWSDRDVEPWAGHPVWTAEAAVKPFLLSLVIAAFAWPPSATAAPDGVPARLMSVGNWRQHDPTEPAPGYEPWTPRDAAGFLELHPAAHLELGQAEGVPAGSYRWVVRGQMVDELRAAARPRGVDLGGRLCMTERPDVMSRLTYNVTPCHPSRGGGCDWEGDMDGRHGEAETVVKVARRATAGTPNGLSDGTQQWDPDIFTHRLVVLRPGSATEERRRVTSNQKSILVVDRNWSAPPRPGDAYEIRGSFDPAWVKRVSREDHRRAIQRFWIDGRSCGAGTCRPPAEPLDPFDPQNRRGFERWFDRATILALATPTSVPALYGFLNDGGTAVERDPEAAAVLEDPYFTANSALMDVSNPAYRTWRARYLLYKLEDYHMRPGDEACVMMAYKPGLHTYYDENIHGINSHPCHVPGIHVWTGPSHVCRDGTVAHGPLHPTPFGPGEYEAGISAYFREVFATLAANGYGDVRVITTESPPIATDNWVILADDVRRHRQLAGSQVGWIDPPLASLAALPDTPVAATPPPAQEPSVPAVPAPPAPGSGSSPPAPPPVAVADPAPPPAPTPAPSDPASSPSAPPPTGSATTGSVASPTVSGGGGGSGRAGFAPAASSRPAPTVSDSSPPRAGFVTSGNGGGGGAKEAPARD